jgi:hypothetical protein
MLPLLQVIPPTVKWNVRETQNLQAKKKNLHFEHDSQILENVTGLCSRPTQYEVLQDRKKRRWYYLNLRIRHYKLARIIRRHKLNATHKPFVTGEENILCQKKKILLITNKQAHRRISNMSGFLGRDACKTKELRKQLAQRHRVTAQESSSWATQLWQPQISQRSVFSRSRPVIRIQDTVTANMIKNAAKFTFTNDSKSSVGLSEEN